jgi:hypothetical protein
VNLFLVAPRGGRAAAGAAEVLEAMRAPFFADGVLTRLPGGACLSHPPERVGGVSYVSVEGSSWTVFAGCPVGPLDAPVDGRYAVVRSDGTVLVDPLGAYPVYEADIDGERWVSNVPGALHGLSVATDGSPTGLSIPAVAGVLGGGWSLSGDPLFAGVRRVLPDMSGFAALCGAGFDAERAASILVENVRALADWPGRPSLVPVTGGRDSRLVLAAALRAGIEFSVATGGEPGAPDVEIGRRVAEAAGLPHELLPHHPHGGRDDRWRDLAGVLAIHTGGTATLADAAGFPLGPLPDPLPLWHTGQGGEIARGFYGTDIDEDGLYRRFVGRRPGRREILSAEGEAEVRRQIGEWAAQQREAGAAEEDLGDLFYLTRRMATWAAPTHAAVEYVRDSTSPLWSIRLLPDLLGLPARARAREEFHLRVLERLAPELVDLPFDGGRPWPSKQSSLTRRAARARTLARKVRAELARRRAAPAPPGAPAADPFDRVRAEVRECVLEQPGHAAWEALDRPRVEQLLDTPAAGLDEMSRFYVWRLATVFGGFPDR